MSVYIARKLTRQYLQDTAVSLKKGDFNTPSEFQFSKRKSAALSYKNFKAAVGQTSSGSLLNYLFFQLVEIIKCSVFCNESFKCAMLNDFSVCHKNNLVIEFKNVFAHIVRDCKQR